MKPTCKCGRGADHLLGALGLAPILSLLAVEGWACSSCLFDLSKVDMTQVGQRQRPTNQQRQHYGLKILPPGGRPSSQYHDQPASGRHASRPPAAPRR